MQLPWQEYKVANPEGYQYGQFRDLHRRWAKKVDLALRQPHRAGEKLFVDYACGESRWWIQAVERKSKRQS